MIMDELLLFSDGQAMAGSAGTILSTNVIDLGLPARDIGIGKQQLWCTVLIETAPAGADTCRFALVSDVSAAIHATGRTQHFQTPVILVADLTAGTIAMQFALPMDGTEVYEQFLGIQQKNVGSSSLAALRISAWLSLDVHASKPGGYPDAAN